MSWFRVDDRLHDHRKVRRVRKSHPDKARDVAPFGLWALAGSWCGSTATGGFVPTEVLEEWDDEAEELAERLVDAGLWWHDEVDGEAGYRFHDWRDQNPHDGTDPGDYGRRGNHIRWHVKRDVVDPECDLCSPDSSGRVGGDVRGESGGESSRPVPTRPVPTRPVPSRPSDGETGVPDGFEAFWDAYDKKVGRKKAEQKYRLALRRPAVTTDSLLAAARSYVAGVKAKGKHPEFTKDPATWLNGEHWTDERTQATVTRLPRFDELEEPPSGLSPAEYAAWERGQREKRQGR